MESPVRVTLIANTGLLLQYRDTTLLLDGLYGEGGHLFSTPSPGTMDKLFQGLPPFEKIDYLLFSHAHSDHFSPALTMEFLRHRRVKGVLLPDAPKVRESGLPEYLRGNAIPYFLLTDNLAQTTFPVAADITVQAIKTLHLDKEYWNDLHFCHLISFGAKKVLFTADADYTMESFDFVKDTPLSAVFLNPLFFSAPRTPASIMFRSPVTRRHPYGRILPAHCRPGLRKKRSPSSSGMSFRPSSCRSSI